MRKSILSILNPGAFLLLALGAAFSGRPTQTQHNSTAAAQLQARLRDASGGTSAEKAAKKAASRHTATGTGSDGQDEDKPCNAIDVCDPMVSAGKAAQQEASDRLKKFLCIFLAEYPATGDAPQHPAEAYCPRQPPPDGTAPVIAYAPRVMVAILPDPLHTQLALRLDESVDDLQNSMQDLGWTYDRAWLPWDNREYKEEDEFDARLKSKAAEEGFEKVPGAILFRPNPDVGTTQPLIVLVVPDEPTEGVNATVFDSAVRVWQQLTGWDAYFSAKAAQPNGTPPRLDILGPTFSGSIPSLKKSLRKLTASFGGETTPQGYVCPVKPINIHIVSGTVSDNAALADLMEGDSFSCGRLHVLPYSMAADLHYEYDRTLQFLDRHLVTEFGTERSKIAILSEDESSFGQTTSYTQLQLHLDRLNARLEKEDISDVDRKQLVALRDRAKRQLNTTSLMRKIAPLHYFFPREISKLRSAYEQNNIFGFGSQPNSVHTQLHLSLEGSRREDDTVHTFSGAQQVAGMEAAMGQLAADLERQNVTVVVLSATDVLDELFVTRYLVQHAPNVAILVTDTDGLFLRGGDSSMENVYVVSPWPLIPGNEEWSVAKSDQFLPPSRVHLSAGSQGVYAAARLLECNFDANPAASCGAVALTSQNLSMRGYQSPFAAVPSAWDPLAFRPPIWLSVVGRGGFWPISLIDADQAKDGLLEQDQLNLPPLPHVFDAAAKTNASSLITMGIVEPISRSLVVGVGIITFLLALHGLACFRARLDRAFAWSYALVDNAHHRLRLVLQCAITLSAVAALVLLNPPPQAGVMMHGKAYTAGVWGLQFVALVLTWKPLAQLSGVLPWPEGSARRRSPIILMTLLGLLELLFAVACNLWVWDLIAPAAENWPTERAFFFYRSAHLLCGSAPTLPVLLLGGALVSYSVNLFSRLIFYGDRIPKLPTSPEGIFLPRDEQISRLNRLLSHNWDRWQMGMLVGVGTGLGLCVLGFDEFVPRSLTHGRLDLAVVTLATLVCFLLLFDVSMAVLAWFLLRADCLLPLSRSPLRWGFNWIRGWSWKRLWAPGPVSVDGVIDHLRRLYEANQRAGSDLRLAAAFTAARNAFISPSPRYGTWAGEVTKAIGGLHTQLALTASQKLVVLSQSWSQDYGPITGFDAPERGLADEIPFDKREPDPPANTGKAASQSWRAAHDRMAGEEFVALLYLGYIRMVMLQIRSRLITSITMYVLLMWALTSYPFMNHHHVVVGLSGLLLVLASATGGIYAQMHRDDILSRTTQTATGKLDADFFTKMLGMVGVPLLTLIASQFPEVSNAIFSWLEPGLSSMR